MQVDVEPGIAIEQKELVIEAVTGMPHRATGTGALGLDRHVDLQTEARLQWGRRRVLDNALCCKPCQQQIRVTPGKSAVLNSRNVEKGNPSIGNSGFGVSAANAPEPAPETAA